MEEHNGVNIQMVLEALDDDDAKTGRRLLRRMLAPDILPCPCCGSPADILEHNDAAEVYCTECGVRTPILEYADAVAIWNRRDG